MVSLWFMEAIFSSGAQLPIHLRAVLVECRTVITEVLGSNVHVEFVPDGYIKGSCLLLPLTSRLFFMVLFVFALYSKNARLCVTSIVIEQGRFQTELRIAGDSNTLIYFRKNSTDPVV